MICPNCHEDTLNEEAYANGQAQMVVCSHCGFKTTLLEYHAWMDIHKQRHTVEKKVYHEGEFRRSESRGNEEPFDMAEIGKIWESIRIPILIIVFLLMLVLIITVVRR